MIQTDRDRVLTTELGIICSSASAIFSVKYELTLKTPLGIIYRTQHNHKAALRTDEINVQSIINGGNK
jgi:hypothetical protein